MPSLEPKDQDGVQPGVEHGYWRSLAELAGEPAEAADLEELSAQNESGDLADPLSRRNFVQLMGASLALAGVAGAGCKRWEKEKIVPLATRPEDFVPGVPLRYASTFELGGAAHGVVVTSYEGRPIKVDGNPEHPFTGGASTAFAQASVLNLYDPDRSQHLWRGNEGATLEEFEALVKEHFLGRLRTSSNKLRFLSEATSSPTVHAMRAEVMKVYPGAAWYEYEPLSHDNERDGTRMVFGEPLRPLAHLDIDHAKVIVVLDGDVLVEHPAAMRYARDFATGRSDPGQMNRLWTVESMYSNTGALADHRLPLRAELVLPFVMALDSELTGAALPEPTPQFLGEEKVAPFLAALVTELKNSRGRSVLIAGPRQPPEVHALVAKLNVTLGNVGMTVTYHRDPEPERQHHVTAIAKLVTEISQAQVETLVIIGGNPVYDAPADLELSAALAKVPLTIHLSETRNETSYETSWHVNRAHYLEAWGDARTHDGTRSIAQPLIQPMYNGISTIQLLAMLVGETRAADELIRQTLELDGLAWRTAVHDGFIPATRYGSVPSPALQPLTINVSDRQKGGSRLPKDQLEVTFLESSSTYDGRFANTSWLQETPNFLTKVTWDNYAMLSPSTASDLGISTNDLLELELGGRTVKVAAYVMAGHAPYSVGLVLGGGRSKAGHVGGLDKKVRVPGFDTNKVRSAAGFTIAIEGKVKKVGSFTLANTQEHWDLRSGLKSDLGQEGSEERIPRLVREATQKEWLADREEVMHKGYPEASKLQLHAEPIDYDEHEGGEQKYKWGMAIDLGKCTGCNSCMVACQAENNVPVVGKNQVIRNREMHWIRIDRYFKGDPNDPQVVHQPVTCQQCENAPCETVCPVGATLHSKEGLNDMVYNRCVGTRYCLNNCPYRVRRFNFLNWHDSLNEARNKVKKLLFNPEVTVRARGVMEKCTFCIQRIQNKKINAKNAGRRLTGDEVTTACQDACPTGAITFGDLNDKESKVAKLHEDRRAYELLGDLNDRPRNRFIGRIRNPHEKLG
jgi:Fe-S-cluster-containing dehydrogenase component/anaerobic selenocysteine-containing dehydrogenase